MRFSSVLRKITLVVSVGLAVLNSGCGGTGQVEAAKVSRQLAVTPAAVDFGIVSPGTVSSQPVTVSNAGNASISVNWTISGAGFSVSGPAVPLKLTQGQSAVLTVTVAPQSPGTLSGKVTISSDAGNSVSVSLSAVAPAPPPPPTASLALNPSSLDFGNVTVDSSSARSVSISNTGNASATISQVSATGPGYSVTGLTVPRTVAAGASISFSVSFTPATTGSSSGSVSLVSDASNSPHNVSITGAGTAAPAASLSLNPTSLDFGSVTVGSSSARSVSISNTGNASATLSQVNVAGPGYSVTGLTVPRTLAAGTSISFNVNFAPSTTGAATGSVSLVSDASNSPHTLSMTGTGTATPSASVVLNPTSWNFGNVVVGNTASKSIVISNTGNASATISQATVTGTAYSVTGLTLPQTLAAGATTSFTVNFSPSATGSANGSVSVLSNAPNSPANLSLSGMGVAPPAASIVLNPASWNFGNVVIGNVAPKSIVISNTGNASATISQATVTGAAYSVTGLTLPMTLAAGATASFTVNFAPSATGTANGSVSVVSNAPNSPANLSLTGAGVVAPAASIVLNPTSWDFGSVTVGNTSTKSVTLSNTGTASATISQATVTGVAYSVTGLTLPATLAAGATTSFTVNFAPAATGVANGSVSVVSNAPNSPANLSLTGAGVAPPAASVVLNPTSWNFGNAVVGSTSSKSIVISNTGNASATISQATVTGTGYSVTGLTLPTTLAAGATTSFTVNFAPAATGVANGSVSVVSNAPNSPANLTLTGTGTAPPVAQLTANPTSWSFGNVTTGTSATRSGSVSNTGNVSVTISQVTASGTGFSVSGITVPVTLSPGQSANYTARFAPTVAGSASGQISFISDASNSPTLVSLAGTGVLPIAQLGANPTSIPFGNVNVGSTSSIAGILTASGASVTISAGTVTGTGFSLTGFGPVPLTLNAGQSTAFTAVFSPTSPTGTTGSITFISTASNSPTVVSLSGTGVPVSSGTPCGQLDDGLIHLPPNYNSFSPPARGQSYVDPQYGCTVVRLTQGISQFGMPAHHYYGTLTAFNADDTKVMLFLDNSSKAIVDLNGNVVVAPGSMPGSNTNNLPWDPVNPAVFYYTNSNQFLKGTVSGNTVTGSVLRTFTGFSTCMIPDQEDVSDDGTKIWLVCTPSGGGASQNVAVAYNLATNTILSQSLVVGAQEGGWHKIQIFPSGKMLLTGGSLCTQCIYNTNGTLYWNAPFAYSAHSDVGTDLQGREVLISTASGVDSLNACGAEKWSSMTVIDINAKAPVNCLIGAPPDPKIPEWEISYRDSANSSTGKWVLLSMFDQGSCPDFSCFTPRLAGNWTSLWRPYTEELVLVKIDGSKTYRLGYSWSRSAENYWAIPRATISRTGKYLVFDSNFNISNTGFSQYSDVYLLKIQ